MHRITVAEAGRDFAGVVDRVCSEGVPVELERDGRIVAHLSPATPRSLMRVRDLKAFIESLPPLGDDADSFLEDVRGVRRNLPVESDPWA